MNKTVSILVLYIAIQIPTFGQAESVSTLTGDATAAELFHSLEKRPVRRSLHLASVLPDGVKGEIQMTTPPQRPLFKDSRYRSPAEQLLHNEYCSAATIVVARAGSGTSFLSSKKDTIFTGTPFAIKKVLKENSKFKVGDEIRVVRIGGDVMDSGELLRVTNIGARPYISGRQYLLLLRIGQDSDTHRVFPQEQTIEVNEGSIIPDGGTWEIFNSGDRLSFVASEIKRLAAVSACSK